MKASYLTPSPLVTVPIISLVCSSAIANIDCTVRIESTLQPTIVFKIPILPSFQLGRRGQKQAMAKYVKVLKLRIKDVKEAK